jgi:hypothetical protein
MEIQLHVFWFTLIMFNIFVGSKSTVKKKSEYLSVPSKNICLAINAEKSKYIALSSRNQKGRTKSQY